jgi:hypothetical protein
MVVVNLGEAKLIESRLSYTSIKSDLGGGHEISFSFFFSETDNKNVFSISQTCSDAQLVAYVRFCLAYCVSENSELFNICMCAFYSRTSIDSTDQSLT